MLAGPSLFDKDTDLASDMNKNEDTSTCSSLDDEVSMGNDKSLCDKAFLQRQSACLERFKLIPGIVSCLHQIKPSLSRLFERCFGMETILNGIEADRAYERLFIQVRNICNLNSPFSPQLFR